MSQPAETHFDEDAAPKSGVAITPSGLAALLVDVDRVVEDAMSDSKSLQADVGTLVLALGAAGVELGVISSQTDALAAAAATVVTGAVFRIIALARKGQKAKVKVAAFNAAGWAAGRSA